MNPRVVIAPLSNQLTRDWPIAHFRELAIICGKKLDATVDFVGTKAQRHHVNAVVRGLPADRYFNRCGLLSWEETGALIRSAACVVSNNSGIGHYAAELGVPLVCVFAATHSPFEWMARGPHVSVLARRTACSLCGVGLWPADCPHDMRCLSDITPEQVFGEVRRLVDAPPAVLEIDAAHTAALSVS